MINKPTKTSKKKEVKKKSKPINKSKKDNRNIPEINKAFMKTHLINKDYKKILNSKYIWCFDERYPTNHTGINDIIELMGYKIMSNVKECLDTNIQYRNFYFENYKKSKYNYFTINTCQSMTGIFYVNYPHKMGKRPKDIIILLKIVTM